MVMLAEPQALKIDAQLFTMANTLKTSRPLVSASTDLANTDIFLIMFLILKKIMDMMSIITLMNDLPNLNIS